LLNGMATKQGRKFEEVFADPANKALAGKNLYSDTSANGEQHIGKRAPALTCIREYRRSLVAATVFAKDGAGCRFPASSTISGGLRIFTSGAGWSVSAAITTNR
jgi:hypothetical protein